MQDDLLSPAMHHAEGRGALTVSRTVNFPFPFILFPFPFPLLNIDFSRDRIPPRFRLLDGALTVAGTARDEEEGGDISSPLCSPPNWFFVFFIRRAPKLSLPGLRCDLPTLSNEPTVYAAPALIQQTQHAAMRVCVQPAG
jgi:hypothetical protein